MSASAFDAAGFVIVPGILSPEECDRLATRAARPAASEAGSRTALAEEWCRDLALRLRADARLEAYLPPELRAVQCTSFEKSKERNWLVSLHRDASIPVAERVDDPVLRGWSQKEGALHVRAPVSLLERLVAVRLHLDRCGAEDGPLSVVPGSHRLGGEDPEETPVANDPLPFHDCLVEPGDALVLRPLLLHRSSKATGGSRRRVLHFLFGPAELPHGLRWRDAV